MKLTIQIFSFLVALVLSIVLVKKTAPLLADNTQFVVLISEALFACFVFVWFIIFHKFWDRGDLKKSVLFPGSGTLCFLFRGILFGFCLIFITYMISRGTGVLGIERHAVGGMAFIRILLVSIVSTALTAFWEELAFRGIILKKLMAGIGIHPACLLVALVFGLLHLLSPVKSVNIVVSTIFAGLLLNYAFAYGGNLYFPIGIHFAWNFFLGRVFYSRQFFEVEYLNKFWAGNKNPEEGLIAISITAAGFIIILLGRKKLKSLAPKHAVQPVAAEASEK